MFKKWIMRVSPLMIFWPCFWLGFAWFFIWYFIVLVTYLKYEISVQLFYLVMGILWGVGWPAAFVQWMLRRRLVKKAPEKYGKKGQLLQKIGKIISVIEDIAYVPDGHVKEVIMPDVHNDRGGQFYIVVDTADLGVNKEMVVRGKLYFQMIENWTEFPFPFNIFPPGEIWENCPSEDVLEWILRQIDESIYITTAIGVLLAKVQNGKPVTSAELKAAVKQVEFNIQVSTACRFEISEARIRISRELRTNVGSIEILKE